jgi:hypothetical protein
MEMNSKLDGFIKVQDCSCSFILDKIRYVIKIVKGIEYIDFLLSPEIGFDTCELRKTKEDLQKLKFFSFLDFN